MKPAKSPLPLTLQQRMIVCVLCALIVAVTFGMIYSQLFRQSEVNQIQYTYEVMKNELASHVAAQTEMLRTSSLSLSYSKIIQNAMFSSNHATHFRSIMYARDFMDAYANQEPSLLSLRFYQEGHHTLAANDLYRSTELQALQDMPLGTSPQFSSILQTAENTACFLYVTEFSDALFHSPTSVPGRCVMLYRLDDYINRSLFQRGSVNYLSIQGENTCVLDGGEQTLALNAASLGLGCFERIINGQALVLYNFQIEPTGWFLSYALPREDVVSSASNGMYRQAFIASFFSVSAMILLILYHLVFISHDIRTVTHTVSLLHATNGAAVPPARLPEMQILVDQLNDLLRRIEEANERSVQTQRRAYSAQLARDRAELAFYRTQISPHFLFNTLECIRSMSRHGSAENVDALIQSTAQLLQYSLYAAPVVTLREELSCAENYISLMNRRSLNAYRYRESVAEEALERPMISMILQPILENAILHGLRGRRNRPPTLLLRVQLLPDGMMEILVADNGQGIPADALAQLQQSIASVDSLSFQEHIGLCNIVKRLKLASPTSQIAVDSVENHYTTIRLLIPPKLEP